MLSGSQSASSGWSCRRGQKQQMPAAPLALAVSGAEERHHASSASSSTHSSLQCQRYQQQRCERHQQQQCQRYQQQQCQRSFGCCLERYVGRPAWKRRRLPTPLPSSHGRDRTRSSSSGTHRLQRIAGRKSLDAALNTSLTVRATPRSSGRVIPRSTDRATPSYDRYPATPRHDKSRESSYDKSKDSSFR